MKVKYCPRRRDVRDPSRALEVGSRTSKYSGSENSFGGGCVRVTHTAKGQMKL